MESLSKIFGGGDRVRIMRMFLFNPGSVYSVDEISKRTGAAPRIVDKEVDVLRKGGLIRRKPFLKLARDNNGEKRKGNGWTLDKNFPYLRPLENLLIQQSLISEREIIRRLSRVAKLKLLVIAGIFIQDPDSRVDILIVGNHFRKSALDRVIKGFEAEIGKEVRYAAFETPEFEYRISMYDKLVRDIFDYPHRKILDKLGLSRD
jgi:hypothetical protein